MEGSSIGPYRIVRKLGEGGMGAVWLGEHALLGRRAAIKVLLREFSAREDIVQRFFNEARVVTAIADPGIVQVFDFGYHVDGSAYLVMEALDGEAMDARLKRIGRFTPVDAVRLMAQVATSLGAAHAMGVIHRDLKPENIFIVGDPAVTGGERSKILDFGIAKLAGDELGKFKTRTGVMMGTPVYMSPEQCRGISTLDARADIYSLGCLLFTMLCGRPPFDGESTGDLIVAHARDVPPTPSTFAPSITPALDALVLRCLEKEPWQRFQSTGELVHALAAVEPTLYGIDPAAAMAYQYQTAPTTLGAASAPVVPTRPPTKRRGWISAIAALVLVGGGAAAIVAGTSGSDRDITPASGGPTSAATTPPAPPPPPVSIDAGAVAVPVDAAEPVIATAVDAAVAPPADAGATEATKIKKIKRPGAGSVTKRGSNGIPTGSGTVDRGD